MQSKKSKVKRAPNRAVYKKEDIFKILDKECLCHVAFIYNEAPVVIPTLYGRNEDSIYIHGASISRMINELEKGLDVSVSVAKLNGLVLARSAFHHSVNYESVVLFGKGKLIDEENKNHALKIISDHIIKRRWEECRLPSEKELKATKVIEIKIEEMSAKVRAGGPVDDKPDYDLDIWAGEIPISKVIDKPIPDDLLKEGIDIPKSVTDYLTNSNNQ